MSFTVYAVHQFKNVGNNAFVVTNAPANAEVEYLIIAGGGGGGFGGGGGAGGYRSSVSGETSGANAAALSPVSVTQQSYSVVVGDRGLQNQINAGINQSFPRNKGGPGGNSSAFGIVANGGGGGATLDNNSNVSGYTGIAGGSGGGGSGYPGIGSGPGGSGQSGQGFAGGAGSTGGPYPHGTGGGGGAGGAGQASASPGNLRGIGGLGKISLITGREILRASGGFGAGQNSGTVLGTPLIPNSGNGGNNSGAGSSGIVITRYPIGTAEIFEDKIEATGGEISTIAQGTKVYKVHQFKEVGNDDFVVSDAPANAEVEYLIVAGGGNAYGNRSGGGGAGGLLTNTRTSPLPLSAGTYVVAVGDGGSSNSAPENGENSSAFGLTAIGGGAAGYYTATSASVGGSGGGAGGLGGSSAGIGASGTEGQGNPGGNAADIAGGGGGGAGQSGQNAPGSDRGGNGGNGVISSITGQVVYYAGGGGGAAVTPPGLGGLGGGGNARGGSGQVGISAQPNTGGGGGGGRSTISANGGSGIVIVRYEIGTFTPGFEN